MPENSQFFEEYYRDLLPKRSYDLSHSLDTSGRIGTVFPVLVEEMIPGDTIKCRMSHITKFMPLISPIQGYVQARFETFFCPNQILMDRKRWETLISNPLNQDFGEIVDQVQLTPNVYNDFSFENWRTLCNSVCVPHMFATKDEDGNITYHGLNDAYDAYSYPDYLKEKTLLNATSGNREYTLVDHCSVWQRDNYAYATYSNNRSENKLGIGWSPNEHIEEPAQRVVNTISAHFANYIGQNTLFDYMGFNIPSMNFTSLEYSLKDGINNNSSKFDSLPNSYSELSYKRVFSRQAQIELDKYHSDPNVENAVAFVLRSLNSREALETCLFRLFGIKVAHDENDSPIIPITLLQFLVGDFFYSTKSLHFSPADVFEHERSNNYDNLVRRFDSDNLPWFVPNDSDSLLNFRYIINPNHYGFFCNAKELLINPVDFYGITSVSWFFPTYTDFSAMQTVDKQFYEDIATQLFYNLYVFGCAYCDMLGFASSAWSYYMGYNTVPYQAAADYPSSVVNVRIDQKSYIEYFFFDNNFDNRASDVQFNVLPLRTYSKIFNDWYKIPDFEFDRYIHDGDEVNEFTDFSLFSRAYARDRFVTAFTNPTAKVIRIGDVNVSDLLSNIQIDDDGALKVFASGYSSTPRTISVVPNDNSNRLILKDASVSSLLDLNYSSGLKLVSSEIGSQVGGFSIEELRVAVRLQNMADYLNKFSGDYVDYMRSVFTVVPSDASLRRSTIVHSYRDAVNVSDILTQTNAEGDQVPAQRYGSAISLGSTPDFDYTTKEHGYLVTLMSIEPLPAYCQGLAPFWKRRTALDFYTPHMCTPQLTPIFRRELLHNMYGSIDSYDKESSPYSNESVFGYNEPDLDYKVRENRVSANVRNKLRTYSLSRLFNSSLTNIGSEFVRIDSRDYDYMFNYIGTEYNSQFVANLYFNMTKYSVVDNEDSEPVLGGEL